MDRFLYLMACATFVSACLAEDGKERSRRETVVWSLDSVPDTKIADDIIQSFGPLHQWGDDSISASTKHSETRALRIYYKKGSYIKSNGPKGAGFFSTPCTIPANADVMTLKYDVYFENFGFGIGGKLPGLFGGENGEGAFKCSGGSNPPTCFSLRIVWRENGAGEIYAYIPHNQMVGFYNRSDVIGHGHYGQSLGRGRIQFKNNKWQTITQEVHLNTVGSADGWINVCVQVEGESQQCYSANNLIIRETDRDSLRGLFFSTFFGGSEPTYAAPNDSCTFFKNFQISVPDLNTTSTTSPVIVG
ncbi:uncharacterized protein LOC101853960 [Aplysia californica]|uniref:Uncharacterized protein LOC101853960 n=1 Tax=Aplysia californica TaxID=6500 RepID=A0ABM1A700_APLCA|nr:uncharacterized protein LOC101853960 [Aplysia californica]XP_035827597.1 uncharacterized protein LOC101853960 [Aplysia californica]